MNEIVSVYVVYKLLACYQILYINDCIHELC